MLSQQQPVKIGEPSKNTIARTMAVTDLDPPVADDTLLITLRDTSGRPLPKWSAGSHIDLDCGTVSRQYSLCGDPNDRTTFQIAVLHDRESRGGGSRWIHTELAVGDTLRVRGPRNHFKLDPDAKRYVFVAGGIGITPIIAMADQVKAAGGDYEIHYAGRSRTSMAFLDRLARDHGDRVRLYPGDEGTRMDLPALFADPEEGTQIYSCGPNAS